MKAMKQVVPGIDLPVSYLTNNGVDPNVLWEIEGGGKLLPVYHSMDGECVTRFHYDWRERISILRGRLKGLQKKWVPILTPEQGNDFLSGEWLRFLWTGDMWQVRKGDQLGQFPVKRLHAKVPFRPSDEVERRKSLTSIAVVRMTGNNMIDETGVAEVVLVTCRRGVFSVNGLGNYASENEAIAAAAIGIRQVNKGKWRDSEDLLSQKDSPRSEDNDIVLRCPTCECPLLKPTGLLTREALASRWKCPKCRKEFAVTDRSTGAVELASAGFTQKAIAAGFTEAQAELLWEMADKGLA